MGAAALVAVVLCALLLTACGSGASSSGSGSDSAAGTEMPGRGQAPEGAEESIEGFGSEAGGSSRASVLAAFHGYLTALGNEDFPKACAGLAKRVRESLAQLGGGKGKAADCDSILAKVLASGAPAAALQQARGTVTKVRIQDDEAFVVFRAPGANLYEMTMAREDGAWKAATAIGSVLVPAS